MQIETTYEVLLEDTLPVIAKIRIEAKNELEAGLLAERIAESQRQGVKTAALEIDAYSAECFVMEGVSDITAVDSADMSRKIWKREEIERLLGETEV